MNFKKRLLKLRLSSGLTKDEIAEKLGIERSVYSRYEAGKSQPKLSELCKIAEIFDVSTDYLIGSTNDPVSARAKAETMKNMPLKDVINLSELSDADKKYLLELIELLKRRDRLKAERLAQKEEKLAQKVQKKASKRGRK